MSQIKKALNIELYLAQAAKFSNLSYKVKRN